MRNDLLFLISILESNFRRSRLPFKLGLAVTYRCNLKCSMCNIWQKAEGRDEIQLNEIKEFFNRVNKFSWVTITGGEPFLREDLPLIAETVTYYCRNLSVLHFATNGMLEEKIIELIRKVHNLHKKLHIAVTVSIDGPPQLHDKIRGVRGSWERAIRTFKALKKISRVQPRIGFTFSHANLRSFAEMVRSIKNSYQNIKSDDINVNVFHKSGFYYGNQDLPGLDKRVLSEEISSILNTEIEETSLANLLRRTYLKLYLKYLSAGKSPLRCKALSSSFYLDPYGNIFPCPIYNQKVLNIRQIDQDFLKIWNSQDFKNLAHRCSDQLCPGCWTPCDANLAIAGSLGKALFCK